MIADNSGKILYELQKIFENVLSDCLTERVKFRAINIQLTIMHKEYIL